jgi:RepB DNA-primase from phage plasmid
MTPDAAAFVELLQEMVPPEARLILCQFPGDPDKVDDSRKWRPRSYQPFMVQDDWNVYLCLSAMGRGGVGNKFRRTKECWQGGLCFMVDDLGTKLPMSLIDRLPPTALIETSPKNYQAIYVFSSRVDDMAKQEALINNFVEVHCPNSTDPGQKGVNRVFRPPIGVNGKAKYRSAKGEWRVRLAAFNPECRYSPERIAEAFGLSLEKPPQRFRSDRVVGDRDMRMKFFNEVVGILKKAGALKVQSDGRAFNRAGWAEVTCPWIDGHSLSADTGAAIRWPEADNDYHGAFRCHHGHCEGRGWRDLVESLDEAFRELDRQTNENAADVEGFVFDER